MKAVPISYIARNLWVRRVTTLLTAGGMALVVYVFATVLMMSEGIRATLVATGQADNVIVLRKGAGAEINSGISRLQAAIIESQSGIATGIGDHSRRRMGDGQAALQAADRCGAGGPADHRDPKPGGGARSRGGCRRRHAAGGWRFAESASDRAARSADRRAVIGLRAQAGPKGGYSGTPERLQTAIAQAD